MKRDIHGYEGVITSITEKALEGLSLDDADKMKDKLAMLQDRYNAIRSDCDDHQDKLSVSVNGTLRVDCHYRLYRFAQIQRYYLLILILN